MVELSEKAKQQFLNHPFGPKDKGDISNPLTLHTSSDLRGVVVAPAGTEPESNLPSEEELKEFKRQVAQRMAPQYSEEELAVLDGDIKTLDDEGIAATEAFYRNVLARLNIVTPEDGLINRLRGEIKDSAELADELDVI